jgi:alpha-glucosidase
VRPLFFEFPADANLLGNDKQFMLGESLLFSPVLNQGATTVSAYFPAGRWYDFYTHEALTFSQGATQQLSAPLQKINIHYRGGTIVASQTPKYTTYETSMSDYTLTVALSQSGSAAGRLYLDDGISLNVDESASSLILFEAVSSASGGRLVTFLKKN